MCLDALAGESGPILAALCDGGATNAIAVCVATGRRRTLPASIKRPPRPNRKRSGTGACPAWIERPDRWQWAAARNALRTE